MEYVEWHPIQDDLQAREVARPEASMGSGTIEGPSGSEQMAVACGGIGGAK